MSFILLTPGRPNLVRGTSGSFGVPAADGHDKNREGGRLTRRWTSGARPPLPCSIPMLSNDGRDVFLRGCRPSPCLKDTQTVPHYMVSSSNSEVRPAEPSPGVRLLLETSGRMNEERPG